MQQLVLETKKNLNIPLKKLEFREDQEEVLWGDFSNFQLDFRESIWVLMEAALRTLMEGWPQGPKDQKRNEEVLEEDDDEDFFDKN